MASVKNGSLHVYYCFDVASEIELGKLEKIFGKAPKESQLQTMRLAPPYMQYSAPPLLVQLGQTTLNIGGQKLQCSARAKIFDFGVITIAFQAPLVNADFKDLAALSDALYEEESDEKAAIGMLDKLRKETAPALVKPHPDEKELKYESYVVFHARALDKKLSAAELLRKHGRDIAHIVAAEKEGLSDAEAKDALRLAYSYQVQDLAVVDWPAAFIFDETDAWDALDVIEYANLELLELRTYDEILDNELDSVYDEMSKNPRISTMLGEYGPTLKKVGALRIDTVSVIEKVENSLKLISDAYLAKIYEAAAERFKLKQWKQSVDRKLDVAEDMYTILSDRVSNQNMLYLELAVIALFVLDIGLYFFGR